MIPELARRVRALPPRQRARWGALVPLGLLTALLEGAGGAVVFALLAVLLDPGGAGDGRFADLVARLPSPSGLDPLVALTAWVAAIHVVKNVLLGAIAWWRARMVAFDTAALSARLLRAYVQAPWLFHLQRSSAALIERLHDGTRPYFGALEAAAVIVTEGAVIIALAAVALAVAPVTVSLMLGALALLLAALLHWTRGAQARGGEQSAALGTALYRHVQHALGAVKEVTVLGRSPFFVDAYGRDARANARLEARRAMLESTPRLVFESAFVLGMLALVAAGSASGSAGAMVPLVSLYAYAGFRIVPAAHRMAFQAGILQWSLAASAPVVEDLGRLAPADPAPIAPMPFREELRAEGVHFTYPGAPSPVFSGIDLTIRRGELVAITGVTGAGKSTLVDILIGLLPPTAGQVVVDGQPIVGNIAGWQRNIGYVPQFPFLLDDTIRRNIALGVPDDQIDEAAVTRAVGLARLDDVVRALPGGLDAHAGELGARLSGGERQRLAIARALYRDPALIVFDEALSAVDTDTERAITEAIDALRGRVTVIVIAHRAINRQSLILHLESGILQSSNP